MSTDLVPIDPSPRLLAPVETDLVKAFLDQLRPSTRRAYAGDLADFARFLGVSSPGIAVDQLFALSGGDANRLALRYRTAMDERGLSTATIARRLSAIRSVNRMARMLGQIWWGIELRGFRTEKRRDVRGPDEAGWQKLWKMAVKRGATKRGRRDRAVLSLLYDLGLRRAEALGLDLADVDLDEGTVAIIDKGKVERQRLTLPDPTRRVLAEWIEARGDWPGPLFIRTDRASAQGRLTGQALADLVAALGRKAKLARPVRPHGLRHSAITRALDLGWDIREVRKFSRHAKIETVIGYDDARTDAAGKIARAVAGERKFPSRKAAERVVTAACQNGPEPTSPPCVSGQSDEP